MGEIREPIKRTSIEKKNKIIEKGFELICEKGYHNVTSIDIAKYAKVSTGIIYQYFQDKRDIFIAGIRDQFIKNIDTRKALININGIQHKKTTKDFPCTIGILFRIENNTLNCDVQSRSTDVVTGLPYDMGFFSVINELLANLLSKDLGIKIEPGYVVMHSNFTQIYDKTAEEAEKMINAKEIKQLQKMPTIEDGEELLNDIYNLGTEEPKTKFMKWSIENGK